MQARGPQSSQPPAQTLWDDWSKVGAVDVLPPQSVPRAGRRPTRSPPGSASTRAVGSLRARSDRDRWTGGPRRRPNLPDRLYGRFAPTRSGVDFTPIRIRTTEAEFGWIADEDPRPA
jgi:hypothetical protein